MYCSHSHCKQKFDALNPPATTPFIPAFRLIIAVIGIYETNWKIYFICISKKFYELNLNLPPYELDQATIGSVYVEITMESWRKRENYEIEKNY